jgi:hypothetical protein
VCRNYLGHSAVSNGLDLAVLRALFDVHVLEFTRLKNLAALLTLDELRVLVAADNLYARVLAGLLDLAALGRSGRL